MTIKAIEIKNVKSIKSTYLDLKDINCLIGENGAGKSNILKLNTFMIIWIKKGIVKNYLIKAILIIILLRLQFIMISLDLLKLKRLMNLKVSREDYK